MTEVRVGNTHNIPRCATAQHCQAILSRTTVCKNKKKTKAKKKGRKITEAFILLQAAVFVFVFPL